VETKKRPIQSINYGLMAKKTIETIYETFQTSKRGLTEGQAIAARNKYGSNQISYGKKTPFIMEVLKAYITPFTLVLIGLGITSFITEVVIAAPEERDYFGSGIIFVMILISGTMTLIQSVQSNKAAEKLKSLVKVTATVKRKIPGGPAHPHGGGGPGRRPQPGGRRGGQPGRSGLPRGHHHGGA